jgi:hypothetical protein
MSCPPKVNLCKQKVIVFACGGEGRGLTILSRHVKSTPVGEMELFCNWVMVMVV